MKSHFCPKDSRLITREHIFSCSTFAKVTEKNYLCRMSCLNPAKIRNKYGNWIQVPCRHCAGCLNYRSMNYSNLTKIEAMNSKYHAFVTLTYSSEALPTVRVKPKKIGEFDAVEFELCDNPELSKCKDSTGRKLSKRYATRVKRYYEIDKVDDFVLDSDSGYGLRDFLKPLEMRKFHLGDPDVFGFLFRPDVINFMKRLRFYIKQEYEQRIKQKLSEKIPVLRYFVVGEYGPRTFRPHYHAEIFFEDDHLAETISAHVRKAWKFGRYDCQLAGSTGTCDYVASYLNSSLRSPQILRLPWNRSFVLHSAHYGEAPFEQVVEGVQSLDYGTVGNRVLGIDGQCRAIASPVSFQSRFFPKCYGFGVSDDNLNMSRYQLYTELFGRYGSYAVEVPISHMAAAVVEDCYGIESQYNESCIELKKRMDYLFPDCKDLKRTVAQALYVSKRFLENCYVFSVSPWYYYHKVIKRFYDDKDYSGLTKQMIREQQDIEQLGLDFRYLINTYTNLPPVDEYDNDDAFLFDNPCVKDFADSFQVSSYAVVDALRFWDKSPVFMFDYEKQHEISENHIKHKVLNDLNKIFV